MAIGGIQMEQQYEQVKEWLDRHKGTLLIKKQELMIGRNEIIDLDEVELQFDHATLGQNDYEDPDDYVTKKAILLHGKGLIRCEPVDEELPFDAYEIPVEGAWRVETDDDSVHIKTERANYLIQKKH